MDLPSRDMVLPDVPGGGSGGSGAAPLVPGTAPANQALGAGSTSSSAISWTDPSGGTSPYTPSTALVHIVGSGASLSGDAVTGLEDRDVVAVTRTWTDADGQTVARTAVVSVAADVGGWETIGEWDLTDADFAALTLTKGAAAVQLMLADGVTPSGLSLRYTDRTAAGTSSAAFVVGSGLQWSIAGATRAIALAVLFDDVTMDGDDVYAVDILYEATLSTTGDCAGWGAGPSHLATAAGWTGAYYYRPGASSYVWLPIRGTGANITAGASTGTLTGPTETVAHTTVIHGGRVQYDYTAQQAALFGATAIPSGAGVTKHLPGVVSTTAMGSSANLYGSAVWATSDLFSAGAAPMTGVLKGIRIRKVDTP
jgi:hypothetical protein